MQWPAARKIHPRGIGISIIVVVIAVGIGVFAQDAVLVLGACVLLVVAILFLSSAISDWGMAMMTIGVVVSLGRLYLTFGPNPFNSSRMEQGALIILLGWLVLQRVHAVKSGVATNAMIPGVVWLGLGTYLVLHVFNAIVNGPTVRDAANFRGALETIFFAPLAFFIAFLSFRGDKNTRQFLWLCLGVGGLQAGLALVQLLFPVRFFDVVQGLSPNPDLATNTFLFTARVYGIWTSAPEFGGLMAVCILAAIYLAWDSSGIAKRILAAAALVILVSALLASASITPIVACLAFVLLMISSRSKESAFRKALKLATLPLVAAIVVVVLSILFQTPASSLPLINRFAPSPTNGLTLESSLGTRMIVYQAAVRLWQNNFWIGVGAGQFQKLQDSGLNLTAHSAYLQTLAETGVVGSLGLVALIASQLWMDAQLWRRLDRAARKLYLPVILVFLIILAVSIPDFTFNKWNFQILFWFSQGIVLAKYCRTQPVHHTG